MLGGEVDGAAAILDGAEIECPVRILADADRCAAAVPMVRRQGAS